MKYILFIVSIALVAIATDYLLNGKQLQKSYSSQFEQIRAQKKGIHDQVIKDIQAEFSQVKPEVWTLFMKDLQEAITLDTLLGTGTLTCDESDPEIVNFTKKALIEYGINPEKVTVKQVISSDTPAQAVQELDEDNYIAHSLELNISWLNKSTRPMQEALIRHEIMHLINYDPIEVMYIITMLYKAGYSRAQCLKSPAMIAYRHQREFRADALASADRPETARALQEYFAQFVNQPHQNDVAFWDTHPSDKDRYAALTPLVTTNVA